MNLIVKKYHFSTKVVLDGFLVSHDKCSVLDDLNMVVSIWENKIISRKKLCVATLSISEMEDSD